MIISKMTLDEKIVWLERYLRTNLGKSHNVYKVFMEMNDEIVKLNKQLNERGKNVRKSSSSSER
ncbi:MAG TPA: hypothetical protein DFI01_02865 [Bacteroidales bacterium]|jgi:hypothetical protein|nr:hypothetical protein [Bacteroidales bacterium]